MGKKQIFHKPDADEIMKGRKEVRAQWRILEAILELDPSTQYLCIDINHRAGQLIPDQYFHPFQGNRRIVLTRTEANRKFMRHGEEVKFPRYRNIDEAAQAAQSRPPSASSPKKDSPPTSSPSRAPILLTRELWVRSYERLAQYGAKGEYLSGVSVKPAFADNPKRKAALVECIDGLMLFQYAMLFAPMDVDTERQNAYRVAKNGVIASALVPSRTPKEERYRIPIQAIPLTDNPRKLAIATTILPRHESCRDKESKEERYTKEQARENPFIPNWDAHSYAAYLAIVQDHALQGNTVPWQTFILPVPGPLLCKIADRLRHDTVIYSRESADAKDPAYHPLNNAEREIIFGQFMHPADPAHKHALGPDELLWKPQRDPKLTEPYFKTLRMALAATATTERELFPA